MFDLKTIATSLIVSVFVVVAFGMVGGNDESLGAAYRMPNSDLSAKSLAAYNPTASSTAYLYSGGANVGGMVIVEDTDADGCSSIAALDGTVVSATVACP